MRSPALLRPDRLCAAALAASLLVPFTGLLCAPLCAPVCAQWVDFAEDPSRLAAPAALVSADTEEKDYAWGDLDNDGDVDLVIVRKQPWTTTGRRANVLLMNENGVLTDRTTEFASASDVAGDQGFLTPTNDRDVVIADVDNDGWPDVITAVTLTDNAAKHLSHPRVYMNLGEDAGTWLGLRHEDARIPSLHPTAGPRFCAVSAGDVTGNGAVDLYFSDYDSGGAQIFDFNDRLLLNNGQGVFVDATSARMTAEMYTSNFGIANAIADMNGDGVNDIVRLTALGVPYHVGIAYNSQISQGFFTQYDMPYQLAGYHFEAGDLNNDGLLDLVVVDDGNDRYLLNQGNDAQGKADFFSLAFPPQTNVIAAGDVVIEDLDLDGWNDVIIADGDVDIPGCGNRTFIFHNQGDGPMVTFVEEDQVIPDAMLQGVHDVAAMDIDGDGRLDLVLGRCSGTEVWMNLPPADLSYTYPSGIPALLTPDDPTVVLVDIAGVGAGIPVSGSAHQFVAIDDGPFVTTPMVDLGSGTYEATLPALACPSRVRFYFSVDMTVDGAPAGTIVDPPGAPATAHLAFAAATSELAFADDMEDDVSAWTVTSAPSLTAGAWEVATPNGTTVGPDFAAPPEDATPGVDNTRAFVTDNGPPGGSELTNDIDGGPTFLVSPLIDLAGADAVISYDRWFFTTFGVPDTLAAELSNTGGDPWTQVTGHVTTGTNGVWERVSFVVGDHVTPTSTVRVRFVTGDEPNDSVTEAGIDDFSVERLSCTTCPEDLDGTGSVGFSDLLQLLGAWGPCAACAEDLNGDGAIGFADVLLAIAAWGDC